MAFKAIPVVSGKISGSHDDFPVYIKPSAMTGWGSLTLAEVDSMRWYADEAKTIELASDPVSADEIHVKVPSLTTTTEIYVDYDGIRSRYAATDTYGRNAVWGDYANVYHMNDATTSTISDSTSNGDTLTKDSASNPSVSAGKLGSSQDFNGTTDFASASYASGSNISETVTFWINTTKTSLSNPLWVDDGGVALKGTYLNNTANDGKFIILYQITGASDRLRADTDGDVGIDDGNWHNVTFTVNNATSDIQVYIDGASVARTMTNTGNITGINLTDLYVGARELDSIGYVDGLMDEIRFRPSTLSANWITTEYNNQDDVGTFWGTVTDAGSAPVAKNGFMAWL